MIEAFTVATIAVFLAFLNRREKKHSRFLFLAFVLLTAFLSLGYYWGNDVAKYEERFEYYSNSGIALFDFSQYGFIALKELGFVFINLLCKPIGFWGMRAVLFILENAILYYFIVKHVDRKWYWLAVFVYVFNPNFWVLSSSMMRQWLAICIVVLATDFLLRNKKIAFVLLVLLASTVHITALICLGFLPLYAIQRKPSKNTIGLFLIVLLLYYLLSPIFIDSLATFLVEEDFYMGYTSQKGTVGITGIGRMVIYFALLYTAVGSEQKDKFLNYVVLLYGFVLPLLSFGELSSRLGFYFLIFTIAVYPLFMNNPKVKSVPKTVVVSIVCAYLLYLFNWFFHSPTYQSAFGNYTMISF